MSENQEDQNAIEQDGYIISQKGEPFKDAQAALTAINRSTSMDQTTHLAVPHPDGAEFGFVIVKLADVMGQHDKKPVEVENEKYFKVIFQPKSSPTDTENVFLSVNGEGLNITRETVVVLPERFLVCADNATTTLYRQEPGKTRKTVGRVRTYPYQKMGEATREEFVKMRDSGTKTVKAAFEKETSYEDI